MLGKLLKKSGSVLLLALCSPAFAGDALQLDYPIDHLIEERIVNELSDTIPDDGEIELRLPEGLPETGLRLDGFKYDPASGMFVSRLVSEDRREIGFRGQAYVVVPTPVPAGRIPAGTVLAENDLKMIRMPYQGIPSGSLRDFDEIVGKQARRVLVDGRPIPKSSLIEPQIVERGEKVTIELASGAMKLTAPGKALQDGAKGDDIRVINLNSNKSIIATIEAPGLVIVEN